MSFVTSDGRFFTRNGKRFFPIGINYLPSYLCGNHFADYRAEHIRADLDHMAKIGLNSVRVAVFWAGYEPQEGRYSEEFLRAFREFVDECRARDLLVMPVFLVGTWTGMYDAPYWKPPGMYEGEMLDLEARHVASFARQFADDPAILCWDLSDEPYYLEELPPLGRRLASGERAPHRDIAVKWVARLVAAIREVDNIHLITLGFDPYPVNTNNGFALEEIAEHLDVMSYCIYPSVQNRTEVEVVAYGAFQTRFFAVGKPSFLHEGPGASSSSASESLLADRFRAWMYSSLSNGTIGVLPWNYTDYQEAVHSRWPLEDAPQEPNFGICRADRSLKPRGEEFLRFAADVRRLPLDGLTLDPPNAALIYPYDYYERAGSLHDRLWRHFTLAKGAGINVDLVREDCLSANPRLLIAPGFQLRLSTWAWLREFVAEGGHLLGIMDEFMFLNPIFSELFGVEVEGFRTWSLEATFAQSWGDLPRGQSCSFSGSASRLWVRPAGADVVASFEDGFPFFLSRTLGRGRVSLATIPFPALVDLSDPRGESATVGLGLLRGARDLAGCQPPVDTDLPWVETAVFRGQAGHDWAVLVHYDRVSAEGTAHIAGEYTKVYTGQGEPREVTRAEGQLRVPVRLGPHGAVLWRLCRE
ncbi:MAG: beta-galactosidase [Armatimonadetes bacterium]|nr:beta-galactosidase [Armatimonadota bacterium]